MAERPSISLLLPGAAVFFDSPLAQVDIEPTLLKQLKKARFQPQSQSLERCLLSQLSAQPLSTDDLPVARLLDNTHSSICADPCYLHPDQSRLRVFADGLQLTAAEAQALADSLRPLFAELPAGLHLDTPQHWRLQLTTTPALQCMALPDMHGQALTPDRLFAGADKSQWLCLWNEIQMLLFEHPVNQQRQQNGKLPVNSLWFWGLGDWHAATHQWRSLSGAHYLLKPLADSLAIPHHAVSSPADWAQLPSGQHLIVYDDFEAVALPQAANRFNGLLQQLLQLLAHRQLAGLRLLIPGHGHYQLQPAAWWQLWR